MIGDFQIFYEAAKAMLAGASPYSVPGFFNPAWALIPFFPLTFFPIDTAKLIYAALTCAGFVAALMRFHLKPRYIILVSLCSSLLWINLMYANVDWLVLLGATLPPPIGIWLVMSKPQVGVGVVLFWLLRAETRRPLVFVPVALGLLINYTVLGLPDLASADSWRAAGADVFPWGLPLAAWLIVQALLRRDINLSVPFGAFAAPYYSITSWLTLAPLVRSWRWLIVVCAASWLIFITWRLGI